MSSLKERHDHYKEDELSLESHPSQDEPVELSSSMDSPNTTFSPEMEHLETFDEETVTTLLKEKKSVIESIQRGAAEKAIPIGIYKTSGGTTVVIPKAWKEKEDCHLAAMIYDFSLIAGFTIRTNDTVVNRTNTYNKHLMYGIWFGLFSNTNQKRRRGKKNYELGRTLTFALIVKNVFEQSKTLGSAALIKDNFFYGNNPSEKDKKETVPFYLKTRLISMFDNPEAGSLLFGIINLTASYVGFSYLHDDERDKVITDNLIPVDQIITACYPTITVKKKKQEVTKTRKPNPLRSSPLFTKEEMQLVTKCSSMVFADLGFLSENYESAVLSHGFVEVSKRIREIINVRWETLQRFAHITKIRLQDIRKIINDPQIRKAKVVKDHVTALLKAERDPASRLVGELLHIMGKNNLRNCYSYAFNESASSESQVKKLLYLKAFDLYSTAGYATNKIAVDEAKNGLNTTIEIDFQKGIKALAEIESKEGALQKNLVNIRSIKYFKLFGRNKNIEGVIRGLKTTIESVSRLDESSLDAATELFTNRKVTTFRTWVNLVSDSIYDSLTWTKKLAEVRLNEETEEHPKQVLKELISILAIGVSDFDRRNLGSG